MRRIMAWVLMLCLALGCTGCKSKEERELENLQKASAELQEAAERAAKEYDRVQREFDAYNRAMERIKNAK